MSIFTDRSKRTSICSLCVDKLKKKQHKFGGFSQDFIEILRNTMGILMDSEESLIEDRKAKCYPMTCDIHFIPVQRPLG